MKILVYYSKFDVSGQTNQKVDDCTRLTHLIQSLQNSLETLNREGRYRKKNLTAYKIPHRLMKLNQVLSSDRVCSIQPLSCGMKTLCLELIFAFSLTSVTKSLHLTIVILQQNKKGETMTGQRIGYIRVSAIDQNIESQKAILGTLGIDKYFEEKVSGKNATDRHELQNMLEYVREGDTIYIKDLSRLARNTKDLLDIVEYLDNKGVALKSLKESIDTSTNFGKLMITFLGAIYEFERANLLERQRDGIAVAKKLGKYKGRKKVEKPANFKEIYQKWLNRQITSVLAIRELKISEYAFYKFVKEENANG